MGKIKDLKDAIVTALQALQYEGESAYGEVVSDTRLTFETYPAARVIMNGQPNEVGSNVQNDRNVQFLVISYFSYENNPTSEAAAFDLAYDFNDLVIDMLDELQPPFTVITKPTQSGWEVLETEAGNQLGIVANVEISYSKDISGQGIG